jgi:hypothetical protein
MSKGQQIPLPSTQGQGEFAYACLKEIPPSAKIAGISFFIRDSHTRLLSS